VDDQMTVMLCDLIYLSSFGSWFQFKLYFFLPKVIWELCKWKSANFRNNNIFRTA